MSPLCWHLVSIVHECTTNLGDVHERSIVELFNLLLFVFFFDQTGPICNVILMINLSIMKRRLRHGICALKLTCAGWTRPMNYLRFLAIVAKFIIIDFWISLDLGVPDYRLLIIFLLVRWNHWSITCLLLAFGLKDWDIHRSAFFVWFFYDVHIEMLLQRASVISEGKVLRRWRGPNAAIVVPCGRPLLYRFDLNCRLLVLLLSRRILVHLINKFVSR